MIRVAPCLVELEVEIVDRAGEAVSIHGDIIQVLAESVIEGELRIAGVAAQADLKRVVVGTAIVGAIGYVPELREGPQVEVGKPRGGEFRNPPVFAPC